MELPLTVFLLVAVACCIARLAVVAVLGGIARLLVLVVLDVNNVLFLAHILTSKDRLEQCPDDSMSRYFLIIHRGLSCIP